MDIEQLNETPHNQICDLARDRFIEVYNQKFGEGGEVFFEEQKAFFNEELLNGSFKGYPKLKVGLGALLQADIDMQTQQKPTQEAFGAGDTAPEDKGVKVKVDSDSPF